MSIINLLTDFGYSDTFVGTIKGVIIKINPQAKIIDLCHNIKPQAITDAAFCLLNSFAYFPKGTIHLAIVDPGVGTKRKAILVETKDYFFIAPDNGLLYPALKQQDIKNIVEITNPKFFLKPLSTTFHGRDIFAPVAAHLSLAIKSQNFGKKITKIKELKLPQPQRQKNELIGKIIYIDHFGNLITNISKKFFDRAIKSSEFTICFADKKIEKISSSYLEKKERSPGALFNSFDNLEIFIWKENAQKILGLNKEDIIRINIK